MPDGQEEIVQFEVPLRGGILGDHPRRLPRALHRPRPPGQRLPHRGRQAAERAAPGRVTPHQLRHTLATQAINRGMSLEAVAAHLGRRSLSMTRVYARIADRTVADEYFAVSEKAEALANRSPAESQTKMSR
ncbi:tyrosine-type recombinase/integrase [Streptomyces cellulosae]